MKLSRLGAVSLGLLLGSTLAGGFLGGRALAGGGRLSDELREIQHALSALEAQAWPIVVGAGGDTDVVVRRLALVTGIVGRGKDDLARPFLDHKDAAEPGAAALAERLDTLFKGTDSPPQQ